MHAFTMTFYEGHTMKSGTQNHLLNEQMNKSKKGLLSYR
jgi:hypothetical protein